MRRGPRLRLRRKLRSLAPGNATSSRTCCTCAPPGLAGGACGSCSCRACHGEGGASQRVLGAGRRSRRRGSGARTGACAVARLRPVLARWRRPPPPHRRRLVRPLVRPQRRCECTRASQAPGRALACTQRARPWLCRRERTVSAVRPTGGVAFPPPAPHRRPRRKLLRGHRASYMYCLPAFAAAASSSRLPGAGANSRGPVHSKTRDGIR